MPRGLGARSWGWAFLGSFFLKSQISLELLLLFSLFLSPFCVPPPPEKTLWRFPSWLFPVSMEELGLSKPTAPSLTGGSHGPPLPPTLALAFTQSFELAPC